MKCWLIWAPPTILATGETMELSHLPYEYAMSEDCAGKALDKMGKKTWRKIIADVVERLVALLLSMEPTSRNWTNCPPVAGRETTQMRLPAFFGCGRQRRNASHA